ncbi:hypothetical protein BEP19_03830 [Ammoniphilus oxalaticus]|uniref:Lin0512 family protein n=1 Tax=Ammoniphilus oxalaticus TaxID=66863 RepID=A0A419SLS8_9BACL|nr:Lin0512 family protein [Ammoniphilus oxalaticus]RKD24976.1 hypothetical protein BEP19_03830 [Ammoniphilus oxalaticus]
MDTVMIIEYGMGIDLHGQDVTRAAVRAVKNAIHHNSLPGLRKLVPDQDVNNMKVNVRLAVPADKDKLDLEQVRAVFPYGQITFDISDGGMLASSGIILEDKGDKNDLAYVVVASIEVGF